MFLHLMGIGQSKVFYPFIRTSYSKDFKKDVFGWKIHEKQSKEDVINLLGKPLIIDTFIKFI